MRGGKKFCQLCFLQKIINQKFGLFPGSMAGLVEVGASYRSQDTFGKGGRRLINTQVDNDVSRVTFTPIKRACSAKIGGVNGERAYSGGVGGKRANKIEKAG